jgi:hypothetical protein
MALGTPGAGHRSDHHRAVCAHMVHGGVLRDVAGRGRADDADTLGHGRLSVLGRLRHLRLRPRTAGRSGPELKESMV